MSPAAIQPRKIDVCDPQAVGRVGEVLALRGNDTASRGGSILRVPTDPEALDASVNAQKSGNFDLLVDLHHAGRIAFLPPASLACVDGFDVTPAGASCARLKVGFLARQGISAWCLLRPCGLAFGPVSPPMAPEVASDEAALRLLRAKHGRFYASASPDDIATVDALSTLRESLEITVGVLRDRIDDQNRADHERHARQVERTFVALRRRMERSRAFRALIPAEQHAIRADVCAIDFDKDQFCPR